MGSEMTFETCVRRLAIGALAAGFIGLAPARAQAPGSLYVFGDSLSDNGNIPRLTGVPYPGPPYVGFRFSNGPVWAEYLPGLTGLNFKPSNDYAVGGAFAGPLVVNGVTYNNLVNFPSTLLPGLPNELQEIQGFAASGGHFSPSDVVGIWIGGNNYFATETLVGADPANAQQIVSQNVSTVLAQTGQAIGQVAALGARQVVLQNLVPFGNVPTVNGTPQLVALGDQIIAAHNAGLATLAGQLHASLGINILLINQQQIFSEISANPAAYGFTNVTDACFASASSACAYAPASVQNQYLWWNVHPTTHGHQVIAEYVASALNGFQSLSVPARLLDAGAAAFAQTIGARMDALRHGAGGLTVDLAGGPMLADTAAGDTGPMEMPGNGHALSVFVAGGYGFGARAAAPGSLGFHDQIGTVTAGADYRFTRHLAAGLAFGYARESAMVNGGERLDADAYQFAAYLAAHSRHLYLDAQLDYGLDRFGRISRPGVLAPITASPRGHTLGATIQAGYVLHRGVVAFGPTVGLDATEAHVDPYTEQGDPALTMSVGGQDFGRVLFGAGLAASARVRLGGVAIRPHGSIGMQASIAGAPGQFASVFTDEPLVGLTTTYPQLSTMWGVADAGVTARLAGRLSATVDLATTFARRAGEQRMVSAGLRWRF